MLSYCILQAVDEFFSAKSSQKQDLKTLQVVSVLYCTVLCCRVLAKVRYRGAVPRCKAS